MSFFKDAWNKVGYKYITAFMLAGLVFCLAIGEFRGAVGVVVLYVMYWGLAYLMRNNQ
jgi:hypothetical protein